MRKNRLIIISFIIFICGIITIYRANNSLSNKVNEQIDYILPDTTTPKLITPYYYTDHAVVADFILSSTGGDMTSAIQNALNNCGKNGGGTVWLEKGIYYITSSINIPSYCTLMGDWQDPDNYHGNLDYGTKIVVDVNNFKIDNNDIESTGLFKLNASTGIEGLTIYYKNQDLNNPKSQPWSIYYMVDMLFNIKNITLINSYLGIGRSTKLTPHETLRIDNVKGTILKKGLSIHNSCDVGSISDLTFSPKYWAKANLKAFNDIVSNNSENSISNKVKEIGGIGLELSDAEQMHYNNISLSGFRFGIYIPDGSKINPRSVGSGLLFNLNITDCNRGIQVDDCSLIDSNHGYLISNGTIEGSEYAIYTAASRSSKIGLFRLNDVSIKGKIDGVGIVIYNNNGDSYAKTPKNTNLTGVINNTGRYSNINIHRNQKTNGNNFAYLNAGSSVDTINNKLASIASSGGGVVYLRPGIYYINKSIIIPSNVELRGSSSSESRIFKGGTVFKVTNAIGTETKAVKLVGSNLGISGINFMYEDNVRSLNRSSSYTNNDYVIMANSSNNVFITNITIAGASRGILINNCRNFVILNTMTGVMKNSFTISNSRDGLIMNTLQNGTVIARNDLVEYNKYNDNMFNYIFSNTLNDLEQVVIKESSDIELLNIFAYGIKRTFTINNSNRIYAVNVGLDVASKKELLQNNNSSLVLVNSTYMGTVNISSSSNAGLYNAVVPGDVYGKDYLNNRFKLTKKNISPTLKVDSMVVLSKSNKEINYYYDGDGVITCKSSNVSYVKCSVGNKKIILTPVHSSNDLVSVTIEASGGKYYSSTSANINVILSSETSSKGDINGNNKIDSADYIIVKKYILKQMNLSTDQLSRADANNDNKVNSADYVTIRKLIINGKTSISNGAKICPTNYSGTFTTCYDTSKPSINSWKNTTIKNTVINSSNGSTTICNLGSDNGDGLKEIEYYTDCSGKKTANISNNCATINIDKCPNGTLYYRLKDNYNYSLLNSVNNIGKYLLFGQLYNKLLDIGKAASNDDNNISYYVSNCLSVTPCIKLISEKAIEQRKNDSNTNFINSLYQAIAGRNANSEGLNFWLNDLNNGISRLNMLDSFMNSNEVKSIYSAWGYN